MQTIYIVEQCVEHEGSSVERVFTLLYDAQAYARMRTETKPQYATDVHYEVFATILT